LLASKPRMIPPCTARPADCEDRAMETRIARMQELVRIVRDVRNRYSVDSKTQLEVLVRCSEEVATDFQALKAFVTLLAGVGKLHYGPGVAKPKQSASQVTPEFEAYVSLVGLIDPAAEVKRLEKQLADKRKQLDNAKGKLSDEGLLARAKPEVVAEQREMRTDLEKQIASIEETIRELKT